VRPPRAQPATPAPAPPARRRQALDGWSVLGRRYHRLLIRWFQYGAFTPIFRVHGSGDGGTELWLFGQQTQDAIVYSAIKLRYALLPYIYSGFAKAPPPLHPPPPPPPPPLHAPARPHAPAVR
jgi:hypothetical protein